MLILSLVFLLAICSIAAFADISHTFQQKNEILMLQGHKIILIDVTNDRECLLSINGDSDLIMEGANFETKMVDVNVKRAFAIRTFGPNSVFCEVLIDIKEPLDANAEKQVILPDKSAAWSDTSKTPKSSKASAGTSDNGADDADANADADIDGTESDNPDDKGWFSKLWDYLKCVFT